MTGEGEMVWSSTVGNYADLQLQQLNGEPVLTFWNGTGSPGFGTASHGYGTVEILNSRYESLYHFCPNLNLVANIDITGACQADVHDSSITPEGNIIVTVYNLAMSDLTGVGGNSSGYLWESQFYDFVLRPARFYSGGARWKRESL